MNRFISVLFTLVWGIWLGALAGTLIAITSLNITFENRETFSIAASGVFRMFGQIQLGLAGLSIVLIIVWRMCQGARSLKTALIVLMFLATAGAATISLYLIPQIDQMRIEGVKVSDPGRFWHMHGMANGVFGAVGLILLVAGVVLPFAIIRVDRDQSRA